MPAFKIKQRIFLAEFVRGHKARGYVVTETYSTNERYPCYRQTRGRHFARCGEPYPCEVRDFQSRPPWNAGSNGDGGSACLPGKSHTNGPIHPELPKGIYR